MTVLDVSSYLGLGAVGAITLNLVLGALITLRYSPKRFWPHRQVNIFALHRWTAYIAVVLTVTHPIVLLFLRPPKFAVGDIALPIHSYLQPRINTAGAAAVYLLLFVLGSSLLRVRIGRPIWRSLHYLVYPAAVLLVVHGIYTDPDLKTGHPNFLDGGKIFIYAAAMACGLATAMRLRMHQRGFRAG